MCLWLSLRVVVVLEALRAQPLLKGKVSEQTDVGFSDVPPAPLFLHHVLQTSQHTKTQFFQRLHICTIK